MGPPEAALLRAGDVFRRIGVGVMMAMIGDPTRWSTAAVEDGREDQEVFDEPVELESAVCEQAMITDGYAEPSESCKEEGPRREP